MRKSIILAVGLAAVVAVFTFNKQSTSHIDNYNSAVDHLTVGEYSLAIPYLEKARESKPNEERILRALEEAYLETGQYAKAKAIGKKLIP